MSKEKLVRFNLMIAPTQIDKINDYRKDVGTLPPKGEAVRDLIELGLKTYWENKEKESQR